MFVLIYLSLSETHACQSPLGWNGTHVHGRVTRRTPWRSAWPRLATLIGTTRLGRPAHADTFRRVVYFLDQAKVFFRQSGITTLKCTWAMLRCLSVTRFRNRKWKSTGAEVCLKLSKYHWSSPYSPRPVLPTPLATRKSSLLKHQSPVSTSAKQKAIGTTNKISEWD